ncbi:MAG: asparagine synthase (glutamine-hydrolyzing), partial [Pseudomonadota bacterium]
MCGIVGRVNCSGRVNEAQVQAMSALVAHRGPDGSGIHLEPNAGLAHRRLAIVDRAHGQQPALSEDSGVILVYNGEVYNHLELRRTLEERGHRFSTRCDTEAILHAHEEHGGVGAARLLRGMFAYAAWEPVPGRLTLVRDRLGIKPLYYAHLDSGDLLFASDLRALLVEPQVDRQLDSLALSAYLALRYVPGPATMLRGVRKLPPGAVLVWQNGRVTIERFWRVPLGEHAEDAPARPPTFVEAAGRLCSLLEEVVAMRRMGEVPLGAFLSGGLDSTLVAAILAHLARVAGARPPCTFSVGYSSEEGAGHDELSYARQAARAIGSRHREIVVSGADVAEYLPRIVRDLDEPIADPAAVSLWFLARRARQEVTLVLSGEGADEVFAGYAIHRRLLLCEKLRRVPGLAFAASFARSMLPTGKLKRALALLAAPRPTTGYSGYRGVSRAFDDDEHPGWGTGSADAADLLLWPARCCAARAPTLLGRI